MILMLYTSYAFGVFINIFGLGDDFDVGILFDHRGLLLLTLQNSEFGGIFLSCMKL